MISKVDECSCASEVCKSVNVLEAVRWTAMAWNDVSESTIVKCFIKAGMLNSEGETNEAHEKLMRVLMSILLPTLMRNLTLFMTWSKKSMVQMQHLFETL